MVGVRVGVLPHRLRVDEENSEGDRHQQEIASEVHSDGLLIVDLDADVAENFNK